MNFKLFTCCLSSFCTLGSYLTVSFKELWHFLPWLYDAMATHDVHHCNSVLAASEVLQTSTLTWGYRRTEGTDSPIHGRVWWSSHINSGIGRWYRFCSPHHVIRCNHVGGHNQRLWHWHSLVQVFCSSLLAVPSKRISCGVTPNATEKRFEDLFKPSLIMRPHIEQGGNNVSGGQ